MKEFFKNVAILIAIIAVLITSIGAFSTGDVLFIVTGVIALIADAYVIYKFIRTHSGGKKEKKQ